MTLDLAALKKLCEEATPGPWSKRDGISAWVICDDGDAAFARLSPDRFEEMRKTAAFIAVARTAVPALIAEVERQATELAKRQWQPIETAPKDGTAILLYRRDSPYRRVKTLAFIGWYQGDLGGEWMGYGANYTPAAKVTHWMPLPESQK